jgi:hypothetical protein
MADPELPPSDSAASNSDGQRIDLTAGNRAASEASAVEWEAMEQELGLSDLPAEAVAKAKKPHTGKPNVAKTSADSGSQAKISTDLGDRRSASASTVGRSSPSKAGLQDPSSTVRLFEPSNPLVMVETAFLASAASLIWLVNFYFPIGPVLRIFFPVPISLIYLRWGGRAAWMGTLVSGLLLSVLMGPPRSLLYIMPYGLMGVLLGLMWRRRASWGMAICLATILGFLGTFFRIWLTSLLLGDDLWLYFTTQATEIVARICNWFGILYQPTVALIQAVVLGLFVINNVVYAFVVHLVAWFLFDRLGNPIPRPPRWVQVLLEYEE